MLFKTQLKPCFKFGCRALVTDGIGLLECLVGAGGFPWPGPVVFFFLCCFGVGGVKGAVLWFAFLLIKLMDFLSRSC